MHCPFFILNLDINKLPGAIFFCGINEFLVMFCHLSFPDHAHYPFFVAIAPVAFHFSRRETLVKTIWITLIGFAVNPSEA